MTNPIPHRKPVPHLAAAAALIAPLALAACAGGGEKPVSQTAFSPAPSASRGYAAPELDGGAAYQGASYQVASLDTAYLPAPATAAAAADTVPPAPAPTWDQRAAYEPLPDLDEIVIRDERALYASAEAQSAQEFGGETRSVLPADARPVSAPTPAPEPVSVPADPRQAERAEGGYALHLASYRAMTQAEEGWQVLTRDHPSLLGRLSPAATFVTLPDQGDFVRLLAGPLRDADASAACQVLEAEGTYCAVVPWDGAPL